MNQKEKSSFKKVVESLKLFIETADDMHCTCEESKDWNLTTGYCAKHEYESIMSEEEIEDAREALKEAEKMIGS